MQKSLEKAVAEAEAVVTGWQAKISALESQAAELNTIVTKAIASREGHALSALLGDANAKAAILKARSDQGSAEQNLADIGHAVPAARAQLASAEIAAQSARTALSHHQADLLKRQRIGVAAKISDMFAALAPLIDEFDDLGMQIANTPDLFPRNMFGTGSLGQLDEVIGHRRLRAALPARFEKIFPGALFDEKRKESLFDSEVRIWNLPPEQPEKKAA